MIEYDSDTLRLVFTPLAFLAYRHVTEALLNFRKSLDQWPKAFANGVGVLNASLALSIRSGAEPLRGKG